jgi:hypothetical protein
VNLKLILMAVGAFVIGLGGSTATIVLRSPAKTTATAAADSLARTRADSLAHAANRGPETAQAAAQVAATPQPATTTPAASPDSAHGAPAAATAHGTPAAVTAAPGRTPGPDAPRSPSATAVAGASLASTDSPAGYRQVARVLAGMKPVDAAKIVAYLSDDQVEGILGQLGVRQAASLLSQLPTERAAALTRRIMKHTEAQ